LDYCLTGTVRERIGNAFPGTVPSGHFRTKDGKWLSLAVGNDRLFERFANLVDRPDLLARPEFSTHQLRVENREELDGIAATWIANHTSEECFQVFGEEVPIGPIHSIADIFTDPHYAARNNIVEVGDKKWGKVKLQAPVPKMSASPGEVKWLGPELGEHNEEIYTQVLGLSISEIESLHNDGII
jgi:crotonobetainyl-CoA:carnitine CoA-transferase CaiB-like acyl-CoA transferase